MRLYPTSLRRFHFKRIPSWISFLLFILFFVGGMPQLVLSTGCGVSLQCLKDKDCPKKQPWCVAGDCKECMSDRHCPAGKRCDPTSLTCLSISEIPIQEKENVVDAGPKFQCHPGEERSCYTGDLDTINIGICRAGIQVCNSKGKWMPCQKEIKPQIEVCDGKDNDCDGKTDEGCLCKVGSKQKCGTDTGECRKGEQICLANPAHWSECKNQIKPSKEICDGKDNDCDGRIDEGVTRSCYTGSSTTKGKGICHSGKQNCHLGKWGSCLNEQLPTKEVCDGKDNDCDGSIDEALTRPCYTGPKGTLNKGICRGGRQTCRRGRWGSCVGEVKPTREKCDGKDNNCDGRIDEGCTCISGKTQSCGLDRGECKKGVQTCYAGKWGVCKGQVKPVPEKCDGKDNDCDGSIDENLTKECFSGTSYQKGRGVCRAGRTTCKNGTWGPCVGEVKPSSEKCDGKDNDCDGSIDEGVTQSCYTGSSETKGKGVCRSGISRCYRGHWGSCVGEVKPSPEKCDRKDNDCDGSIDENLTRPCYTVPSYKRNKGECHDGIQTCQKGSWGACVGEVRYSSEICDGKDNDCDGRIDENYSTLGRTCIVGKGECQRRGKYVCSSDHRSVECDVQEGSPSEEVCDGKDNDCDGSIDEGLQRKPCQTGKLGICSEGELRCYRGKESCRQLHFPTSESCNGKDDDCDGFIDEGVRHCVSTFAGSTSGFKDGPRLQAQFNYPVAIVKDSSGNIYVLDRGNYCIRKIDTKGNVTTFAGSRSKGYKDGPPNIAQFSQLSGIAIDSSNNLYVTDGNFIRKIDGKGYVSTFAGSKTSGSKDSTYLSSSFNSPTGLAFDSHKRLFVADTGNHCIRLLESGRVTTYANLAHIIGNKDETRLRSTFHAPEQIAIDANDVIYITDAYYSSVRNIKSNQVSTILLHSKFNATGLLLLSSSKILFYYTDSNDAIHLYDNWNPRKIAGGTPGLLDGFISQAKFFDLKGIISMKLPNSSTSLLVVDSGNHRLRLVNP